MSYVSRALSMLASRARQRYRYYRYWRAEERKARARSAERIRAEQWQRLTELLEFAYDRIPFYKDRFREAGISPESIRSWDDLARIPPLTKDDIRQNFPDRLVRRDCKFPASMMGHTSGSTGESIHFVGPDHGWQRSLEYSMLLRTGRIRNIPVLTHTTPICSGGSCSLNDVDAWSGLPVPRMQRIWFLRHLEGMIDLPSSKNVLSESDRYMARMAEILGAYSPCMVIADPVYFASFARYLKRTGSPVPKVAHIITTFELLTGSLRDMLREVFACDVFTQYGSTEIGDIADECEHHKLHVRPSNVVVEAIRDGGPAVPGQVARAIVTDLGNYNMPFIRYDIGDVVTMGDGACACGRHTDTIEAIHGRVGDTIRADGAGGPNLVTPLQADGIFRGIPGIAAYSLVQRAKGLYKVGILPEDHADGVDQSVLLQRCKSLLGEESRIDIGCVDSIKPRASMKYRFVWSEMPGPSL